jgi:ATP-dependent Clp protease adaptor protein ClpS
MTPKDEQSREAGEGIVSKPVSEPQAESGVPGSTGLKERPAASPPRVDHLPQFRVLLHNDAKIDMVYVVETLCDLTPLMPQRAAAVMLEAHRTGVALVLVTHRERAELYVDQFQSKSLVVTIEPAE